MRVIGFTLLGAALFFIIVAFAVPRRANLDSATPTRLHISELTKAQLDGNRHVLIEGVFISAVDALSYESHLKSLTLLPAWEATDEFKRYYSTWLAVGGNKATFRHPEKIPLIIRLRSEDLNVLIKFCEGSSVQGMLTSEPLAPAERAALGAIKPGFQPDQCLVITAGELPLPPRKSLIFPVFGAAIGVVGLVLVLVGRPKPQHPVGAATPPGQPGYPGQMGRMPPTTHLPADPPNPFAPPPTLPPR